MRHLRVIALLALSSCAAGNVLDQAFGPDGRTLRQEISSYPREKRDSFVRVEAHCGAKCHSLNEVFASHIGPGEWSDQVRLMSRKKGAGIPPGDQKRITEFLEFYAARSKQGLP